MKLYKTQAVRTTGSAGRKQRGPGRFSTTNGGGKRVMAGPTSPRGADRLNRAAIGRNETKGRSARKSPRIA